MTALVEPHVRYWPSWAATVEDFGDGPMDGSGSWQLAAPPVPSEAGCAAFVQMTELTSSADLDGTRVPSTFSWITAGEGGPDEVIGFLHLRHALDDWLLAVGGHIGYSVRPAARRRGHAGRALDAGLAQARGIGLARVLLTCDVDNEASRRTIVSRGGELEDVREGKERYWIEL
ncbi:GNAT family N-acetyltransferase [Aeromicrobium sp.]|uniref:GNAT family N-acetyltransferase n=1 Tax=Aeromicrobium sp. TaxID=1871063 RepID=UPI003516E9A8